MTDTATATDLTKLGKIRALLDKAAATAEEFPEEADALTTKALELMERYRIDEAMIADAAPLQDRGKIIELRINVGSGPYVNTRVTLADQIAQNFSVKLLQATDYRGKTIFLCGYETDIALTEMLYTSLLVQATRAANSPETRANKSRFENGISFTRSFLLSFAYRIGERLRAANATAVAETVTDGRSVALVLADRTKDVDEDIFRRYGKLKTARPQARSSSMNGSVAGVRAADAADLSTNRRVNGTTRGALSA